MMSTKLMVELPGTMAKLAESMTAVVKLVEAQVERGAASGPSAYDEFEQSLMEVEAIVGKRGVSTALGAIVEGSERGCASRRSARARGGADEEVLDDVGAFSASDDLLIAAA